MADERYKQKSVIYLVAQSWLDSVVSSACTVPMHTADTELSVTNFFCLHFSEHAQWGFPVMSDILVKIFVDISCNICGLFLL